MSIIVASGPVIIENNKVLLNQSGEDDFWKFCGGGVADYEVNLKDTARRRVKEEMGLEIEILEETPFFFYTEKNAEKTSVVLVHFLAKRLGEVQSREGVRAWRWFGVEDLSGGKLAPNILPVLDYFNFGK